GQLPSHCDVANPHIARVLDPAIADIPEHPAAGGGGHAPARRHAVTDAVTREPHVLDVLPPDVERTVDVLHGSEVAVQALTAHRTVDGDAEIQRPVAGHVGEAPGEVRIRRSDDLEVLRLADDAIAVHVLELRIALHGTRELRDS